MKFPLISLLLLGAVALPVLAENSGGVHLPLVPLSAWTEKSFKGETHYSVEQHNGRSVLRADSKASASGYYHKLELSAKDFPHISWSWKISRTIATEDPFQKSGDDYAARVYIVFPGRFFWQKRAIAYVWSDKLPVGKVVPNPYTDRVAIIAVESGNSLAGSWRNESRNYVDDYRAYFHHEPDKPEAVAFMTDTDNTGSHAVAWYGDISFSR